MFWRITKWNWQIFQNAKGEKVCSIGFITTDDFHGFHLSWAYSTEIDEYYDLENGTYPDFLYQSLVDIVDSCKVIDFYSPSDAKFIKNGFRREDVLFFATMGDGDYIEEMIKASVKMFNVKEILEAYIW